MNEYLKKMYVKRIVKCRLNVLFIQHRLKFVKSVKAISISKEI